MALFLDCAFVAILLICCIVGYVKGFTKLLIGLVATVVASAVAFWGASSLSEPVYDRYFKDTVHKEVRTAIENVKLSDIVKPVLQKQGLDGILDDKDIDAAANMGGDLIENIGTQLKNKGADSEQVSKVKESISTYFGDEMMEDIQKELNERGLSEYVEKIELSSEDMKKCVQKAVSADKDEAADYISEKAVKPIATGAIKCLMFMICFALVQLLFRVIILISGVMTNISELKAADRFGGLALGAAEGLFYCGMIAFMLCTLAAATKNSLSVFSADTSEQTYIFRLFFNLFYK